jgi:hypothetical protein
MKKYLTLIVFSLIASSAYGTSLIPCGLAVMNIHEKNPNLEGFAIQQYPDWDKETKVYEKGHPYIVFYKFKKGMDHIVFYSASGQVLGGEWEKLPKSHWKKYKLRPVEDLHHECRGNNSLFNE